MTDNIASPEEIVTQVRPSLLHAPAGQCLTVRASSFYCGHYSMCGLPIRARCSKRCENAARPGFAPGGALVASRTGKFQSNFCTNKCRFCCRFEKCGRPRKILHPSGEELSREERAQHLPKIIAANKCFIDKLLIEFVVFSKRKKQVSNQRETRMRIMRDIHGDFFSHFSFHFTPRWGRPCHITVNYQTKNLIFQIVTSFVPINKTVFQT